MIFIGFAISHVVCKISLLQFCLRSRGRSKWRWWKLSGFPTRSLQRWKTSTRSLERFHHLPLWTEDLRSRPGWKWRFLKIVWVHGTKIGICGYLSVNTRGSESPSHNTSNNWSHVLSGRGYSSDWFKVLLGVGVSQSCPVWDWGTPKPGQDWGTPGQDWSITPPPHRLHLDRLCCRQYASCGFRQEYCLVSLSIPNSIMLSS